MSWVDHDPARIYGSGSKCKIEIEIFDSSALRDATIDDAAIDEGF